MKPHASRALPLIGSSLNLWKKLRFYPRVRYSFIFLSLLAILCFLAPWISPHSPEMQNLDLGPTPPSLEHWLGTDLLGRDVMARVLYGGRVSFSVGFLATLIALTLGLSYGAIAGYCGGKTDRFMMRAVEILYSMPFVIFVILLVVLFGRKFWLIFVAIGAVEWLTMARIVRGQVLVLKEREFICAARILGQSHLGILYKHLLPNILGTLIVYATLTIPHIMLLEALLSFLGLGVQPPATSWGNLIHQGIQTLEEYPWLLLFPCLFFSLTLFSLNFLGDGLRDAFDPRT